MCRSDLDREDQIARKVAAIILNDEMKKNAKISGARDSLLDYGSRCLNIGICVQRYYEADSLIQPLRDR